jgi:hypothetical protein
MKRHFWMIAVIALLSLIPIGAASAQSAARCFPETGYCISGPIRTYWERNGGLPAFGYPTGPVETMTIEGWTGPAQWFERDRLEDHSAQGEGVLAGRLGAERLEQMGRPWQYGPNTPPPNAGGRNCLLFSETGYHLCGTFRTYWEQNGGLMRFGYPITDVYQETIEGRTLWVQYFERRRMEQHPENRPPYDTLLGLLGNEIRGARIPGCNVAILPELMTMAADFGNTLPLGCPKPGQDYSYTQAAAARFERGQMYWVKLRGNQSIVVVITYRADGSLRYQTFADTWREGDAINSGLTPPAGLYEPNRGFGKVWREQRGVRDALGWALEQERPETVSYQVFDQGALLSVMSESSTWQLGSNGVARSARTRY